MYISMHMFIYIFICICIYMYFHIYIHIYVRMYKPTRTHLSKCVFVCLFRCMQFLIFCGVFACKLYVYVKIYIMYIRMFVFSQVYPSISARSPPTASSPFSMQFHSLSMHIAHTHICEILLKYIFDILNILFSIYPVF